MNFVITDTHDGQMDDVTENGRSCKSNRFWVKIPYDFQSLVRDIKTRNRKVVSFSNVKSNQALEFESALYKSSRIVVFLESE